MLNFVYGFIGAVSALILFGSGVVLGWRFRSKLAVTKPQTVNTPAPEPETFSEHEKAEMAAERNRLLEEQRAFNELLQYNPATVYSGPSLEEIEQRVKG